MNDELVNVGCGALGVKGDLQGLLPFSPKWLGPNLESSNQSSAGHAAFHNRASPAQLHVGMVNRTDFLRLDDARKRGPIF